MGSLHLLETQGNALLVTIDIEDENLEHLTDVEKSTWVANAAPAHVGNVEQSVHTLEVNKGTKVGDVLHLTFDLVANLDALKEVLTHFSALAFDHLTA